MINRRHFLKAAGLISIGAMVDADVTTEETEQPIDLDALVFSPTQIRFVQGATNANSTLISILAHKDYADNIDIFDQNKNSIAFQHKLIDFKLSEFVIHQLFIDGLSIQNEYSLLVTSKKLSTASQKNFKTLDWNRQDYKIAFLSCSSHNHGEPTVMSNMEKKLNQSNSDVLFFLGDAVYADTSRDVVAGRPATPENAYKLYVKTLMELGLYSSDRLKPIFAIFDDHDLAYNDADSNHPHLNLMTQIFRAIYPVDHRINGISMGPGCAFSMKAFGWRFVFIDGRSFRDGNRSVFLGPRQMNWLNTLLQNDSSPCFFISSQQFFNYKFFSESFEKTSPEELSEFIKFIKNHPSPCAFMAGDVHYSQIHEIDKSTFGYTTYELSSSAFFSLSAKQFGKRSVRNGQLAYYGYPNFIEFKQINNTASSIQFQLTCVSEKNSKEFEMQLSITK